MKPSALPPLLPRAAAALSAALLCLALGACSTVESRIKERPQAFAALTPHQQALVRSGVVANGMPQDAVYIAWGKPDLVTAGQRHGKFAETWFYYGTRTTTSVGFATGFGCGPYSAITASFPLTVQEEILRAWAAFEDRVLVAWEKARL